MLSTLILALVSVLAAVLVSTTPLQAAEVDDLYDVELLVADESSSERQQAFVTGLDEIFVRVSGDSIIMDKIKRPNASSYVKQFHYSPVDDPQPGEDGKILAYRLFVQYNGSMVERNLREQKFPVWGQLRPDVAVWLAVYDGRNEYVLRDSDESLIKSSMASAMKRRGVPERWPLYDATDRRMLSIADIRGGFDDAIHAASRRYTIGPALSASLRWNGNTWQSSWNLILSGETRHWSIDGDDYQSLIDRAIDRAADAMGQVYAVSDIDASRQFAVLRLDIQSVDDIDKYRQVEDYLANLAAVNKVLPVGIDAGHVRFDVSLRSSTSDFLNLVRNDARLAKLDVEKPEPSSIEALQAGQGVVSEPAADYSFRLIN
jgi:hypothetical protein